MDLLMRYGKAFGGERFVDTASMAGIPGTTNQFFQNYCADGDADQLSNPRTPEVSGTSFEDVQLAGRARTTTTDSEDVYAVPRSHFLFGGEHCPRME